MYPELNFCSTLFFHCKPFYISPATTCEMESCLHSKCLNPDALYNTLWRHIKDIPALLSECLTMYFECEKDMDIQSCSVFREIAKTNAR